MADFVNVRLFTALVLSMKSAPRTSYYSRKKSGCCNSIISRCDCTDAIVKTRIRTWMKCTITSKSIRLQRPELRRITMCRTQSWFHCFWCETEHI